jgi:hypothetical protein
MPGKPGLFRYRKTGINQLLGITQTKRKISKQLGLAALRDPATPLKNMQRRTLRKIGYYSEPMKLFRALGLTKRGGCSSMFLLCTGLLTLSILQFIN